MEKQPVPVVVTHRVDHQEHFEPLREQEQEHCSHWPPGPNLQALSRLPNTKPRLQGPTDQPIAQPASPTAKDLPEG